MIVPLPVIDLVCGEAILARAIRNATAFGKFLGVNDLNVSKRKCSNHPLVNKFPDTVDGNTEARGYFRRTPSLNEIEMNCAPLHVCRRICREDWYLGGKRDNLAT